MLSTDVVAAVSPLVVLLTQISKWSGLPDRFGPLAVMVFSAIGLAAHIYSQGVADLRPMVFSILLAWATIAAAAAGIYGFTRAVASNVTTFRPPPSGAGAEPTKSS